MPRTDPPPAKKELELEAEIILAEADFGAGEPAAEVPGEEPADVEITTGETDIALDDLDLDEGDDPCPSPFERPTIAPAIPESEYVARMMREAPLSDPVPPTRRAPVPEAVTESEKRILRAMSTRADVTRSAGRVSPDADAGDDALTLDLDESAEPPLAGSADRPGRTSLSDLPTGVRDRIVLLSEGPKGGDESVDVELEPDFRSEPGLPVVRAVSPIPSKPVSDSDELSWSEPPDPGVTSDAAGPTENTAAPTIEVTETNLDAPQGPLSFGPTSGDALELVDVRAQSVKPPGTPKVSMRAVRDRFDVGDFSGALVLAEGILEGDPESVDALLYAEHCRDVLKQMYISRLGGVGRVPHVVVSDEQLRWLSLDHRAGFLLSLVDGQSTFEELLDVSGMPPIDSLRLLLDLLQQNVIRVT